MFIVGSNEHGWASRSAAALCDTGIFGYSGDRRQHSGLERVLACNHRGQTKIKGQCTDLAIGGNFRKPARGPIGALAYSSCEVSPGRKHVAKWTTGPNRVSQHDLLLHTEKRRVYNDSRFGRCTAGSIWTNGSRARPHRWCWPAGTAIGERRSSSSRVVAAATTRMKSPPVLRCYSLSAGTAALSYGRRLAPPEADWIVLPPALTQRRPVHSILLDRV
jgi:hypothetical protein